MSLLFLSILSNEQSNITFLYRFKPLVCGSTQRRLHTADWRELVQTFPIQESDPVCSTSHLLGRQRYVCSSLPAWDQVGSNGYSSNRTPLASWGLWDEQYNHRSSWGTLGHFWWYLSTLKCSVRNRSYDVKKVLENWMIIQEITWIIIHVLHCIRYVHTFLNVPAVNNEEHLELFFTGI